MVSVSPGERRSKCEKQILRFAKDDKVWAQERFLGDDTLPSAKVPIVAMENIRTVLRGSLGRSLGALDAVDRLAAAWPVACGRAMADHGEIVAFFEGTVTIAVSDEAWLRQMMSMQSQLKYEIARIAQVKVTGIHFQMKKR